MAVRNEDRQRAALVSSRQSVGKIVAAGIGTGLLIGLSFAWWYEAPSRDPAASQVDSLVERSVPLQPPQSANGSDAGGSSAAPALPDSKSLTLAGEPADLGQARRRGTMPFRSSLSAEFLGIGVRPSVAQTSESEPRLLPADQDEDQGEGPAPSHSVRVADEGALEQPAVRPARLVIHEPVTISVSPSAGKQTVTPTTDDDEGETIRLMHDLQRDDAAKAAEHALIERGFTELHLRLARQLTSPDAEQRAQLAAKLPGVSGIDARLWLTWLLRDDSPRVRAAALSVLATTGDPETLRRVLEIVRQDRDPVVRALLSNIDKSLRTGR